ncbi:Extracellular matrix-binding ebh, putative [Babesia ovata]|uniref:Extracellular matrix-binding ebh, putative n=1 Tax=Babesia ovata TaxID=189622 RepID=A0A2H6K771_9APIC|nr:Extracellular matrix-binding ebh, putative [Babesia ovata]GBE58856.1 Extracellular matrix-binding ebh, putative [Babesia ovata]
MERPNTKDDHNAYGDEDDGSDGNNDNGGIDAAGGSNDIGGKRCGGGEPKTQVGQLVTEALQAVVKMDKSLKMDLKKVKEEIKDGIAEVIQKLKVTELDSLVKIDLGTLRKRISDLKDKVTDSAGDGNGNIVGKQLEDLKDKYATLDKITHNGEKSIVSLTAGLEGKFKDNIQQPLSEEVNRVYAAIGKVGEKFEGKSNIEGIFRHIKDRVGEIKGESGQKKSKWYLEDGSGLLGIEGAINHYFEAFSTGHDFKWKIVKGWLDDMLPHNGVVKKILKGLGWDEKRGDFLPTAFNVNHSLTEKIRDTQNLSTEIQKGVDVFKGQQSTAGIQEKIKAVKTACETFADALDAELKNPANGIVNDVKGVEGLMKSSATRDPKCICECGCYDYYGKKKEECAKKAAAELIMCALTAVSRQVGKEVDSLMLADYRMGGSGTNKNIATALDDALKVTNVLHGQLDQATDPSSSGGQSQDSPAQAVDKRLAEVSTKVGNLVNDFNTHVKQPLKTEVDKLPQAVEDFNRQAQAQIRNAAKMAIAKAADEIKMGRDGKPQLEKGGLMSDFETAHKLIREKLDGDLKKLVEDHIGEDDPPGQQGGKAAEKVKITKAKFPNYDGQVDQKSIEALQSGQSLQGTTGEGSLPEAIGDIKTDGLKTLTDVIDPNPTGQDQITADTFTGPFDKIKEQLDEIKKLVDEESDDDDQKGVMTLLNKLKNGLNTGKLNNADEGLEAIRSAIDTLQAGPFSNQPKAIGSAVQAIRQELGVLSGKLKKENGDKDDVIERLNDMKEQGLGTEENQWTPINGKGKPLSGLGRIHGDLGKQNRILPEQTQKITRAISAITFALRGLGLKLNNGLVDDTITDLLKQLKLKIGVGTHNDGNLKQLHEAIQQLQQGPFKERPDEIHNAKQQIVDELGKLRNDLQGSPGEDVIATLNDLQSKGLSGKDKWNGNKKGLAKINSDLNTQQSELSGQPTEIGGGVGQITNELQNLQKQLQSENGTPENDVISALEDLRDTELGDKDWKKQIKYKTACENHQGASTPSSLTPLSTPCKNAITPSQSLSRSEYTMPSPV